MSDLSKPEVIQRLKIANFTGVLSLASAFSELSYENFNRDRKS